MSNDLTFPQCIGEYEVSSNSDIIKHVSRSFKTQIKDLDLKNNQALEKMEQYGRVDYFYLNQHCVAQVVDLELKESIDEYSVTEGEWIGMKFALNGDQVNLMDNGEVLLSSGPRFNVCYVENNCNSLKKHLEGSVKSLNILLKPIFFEQTIGLTLNSLKKALDECSKAKDLQVTAASLPLTAQMNSTVSAIINTPFQGTLYDTWVKTKIIELLCLSANSISNLSVSSTPLKLTNRDKVLLEKVKQLIQEEYVNPPSLKEISRSIGLNRNKLSMGFKELFGTGVYEYCQNYRMIKARELLQNSNQSILEIALEVGFQNHSSFSRAYKDFFKIAPSVDRSF